MELLILTGATILANYIELRYDMKIAKVIDGDGFRTKEEDAIIHSAQISWRLLIVGLIALIPVDSGLPSGLMIAEWIRNIFLVAFISWIVFDIMVNKIWLKQKLFYTGTTSRWDRWFPTWKGALVKIIGLTIILLERFGVLGLIINWIR